MTDYIQIHFNLTDDQYNHLTVQQKLILDYIAAFGSDYLDDLDLS